MPVKWDPGMDQLLLLKILETHELKVDAKKISAAWPADQGDQPTPRAITERLVKIRANSRAAGAGHFGISSAQSKGSSPSKASSVPTTPSKKTVSTPSKNVSPAKRKKPGDNVVKIEDDEAVKNTTPSRKEFVKRLSSGHELVNLVNNPESLSSPVKGTNGLSVVANEDEDGSPSKRPRRASAQRMTAYESDGDAGAASDASDFHFGLDGAYDEEIAV